ncbi:hypothetical protein [Pelomonas cellulosilytica]|uniref:Uncharacterized protein n=1 Tax=Pelomonas cellulosilytica TaxID=2906762 RepID=A0ABS8XW87_9BURK|nr:hypothetical protein [Pelomonas sp. P8]MCE4555483.1 hypothetical protein [Pelomonas sp. P8]
MKPQQLALLVSGALLALVVLSACRKEVPPTPAPDNPPKPTVLAAVFGR